MIAQSNDSLVLFAFKPLLLGSIRPASWLKDQLTLSASGLASHQHDFYDFVMESTCLGSIREHSSLRGDFPQGFNGLVPLGCMLNSIQRARCLFN
jgi:hypothetical protein